MNRLFTIVGIIALAGCATAPKPLQGEYASEQPSDGVTAGTRVRWGGEIISVEPMPAATCMQVLSRELTDRARPRDSDRSAGRFLACREGFYDPAVFAKGREVTVTGAMRGTESRRIGDYDYPLPRVEADVIYLWPERPDYLDARYYGASPFWYPGWYGVGYYGPAFHYGYYRRH